MARRPYFPFNGKRFIGNADEDNMKVHDLDNEDTSENGCQIDEIKKVKTFTPDSIFQAKREGFTPCEKCASHIIVEK